MRPGQHDENLMIRPPHGHAVCSRLSIAAGNQADPADKKETTMLVKETFLRLVAVALLGASLVAAPAFARGNSHDSGGGAKSDMYNYQAKQNADTN
jgi:hypothetical protein